MPTANNATFGTKLCGLLPRQRREAASKQLIDHYKGEAERLLTMTINSKSVAQSTRVEKLERENLTFQQQVLDLEEKLLAYETGAQPVAYEKPPFAPMPALSEYPTLAGAASAGPDDRGDDAAELRKMKKLNRAFKLVTGLEIEITPEQKVVATMQNNSGGRGSERLIEFELDVDEENGEVEYQVRTAPYTLFHRQPQYLSPEAVHGHWVAHKSKLRCTELGLRAFMLCPTMISNQSIFPSPSHYGSRAFPWGDCQSIFTRRSHSVRHSAQRYTIRRLRHSQVGNEGGGRAALNDGVD